MKELGSQSVASALLTALLLLANGARAASVPPTGYANDFGTQPAAADWATSSRTGGASDNYDPDTDVNANMTASGVNAQTTSNATDPATALATATWSSTGHYLQTRPTGNRYTALMGKFVNNTGTNATQITLSYLLTIAAGPTPEDAGKGTRAYYSLTGVAGGWTNLAALNSAATNNGSSTMITNLSLNWTNGASLYLLWVDDNASAPVGTTDPGNQIDNFSLQVTAGSPPTLACTLSAPGSNAVLVSGAAITAAAAVRAGTPPYIVEYFTNSGAGNPIFASAGSSATTPYTVSLGSPPAGAYNLYAVAADGAAPPASATSITNTFFVADPVAFTLTAPVNDASYDNLTPVTGEVTVSGGTPPYSVRFFLDNSQSGAAITSAPYERAFGALVAGDHTIRATVVDARGWSSNSAVSTVHITGPLGATLTPPDGTLYSYGSSISVTGTLGGGSAPYAADFYVNDQLAGSIATPPFILSLGVLPVGNHAVYVHATDSSAPTAQQNNSATNTITIQPNPITVTLTSPAADQSATAGTALTLAATATVGAPLTVTNVQFFYDGAAAGVDATAPYSGSVTPAAGTHTVYAAATDSLGRRGFSATNQFTATPPTGNNNNFANAIPLAGPIVTTTGNNLTANKEFFEPNHGGNQGGASVWWTWIAISSGPTTIDTMGSDFNTLLGVYTGNAVNFLTTIAGNNDFNGNTWSRVQFNAVAGTLYRIAVDGQRTGGGGGGGQVARGNIVLHVQGVGGLTITTPTNGMVFTLGDPIPVNVTIDPEFPNPPATRVDFYRGGILFASSGAAPFSAVATNAPAGTNGFSVIAIDSTGAAIQSGVVNVFVQRLGVTLLSPAEDATFLNTNPITVSAHGYLPSGSITNIEFFVDGLKFGEDATAPFSAVWSNVTGGSHRLTAIGKSDTGVPYNSQPVNIGVASLLVHSNAVWKYLDNGSDQGTNWVAPGFDDSTWASGPAELGYGDNDERTLVNSGPTNNYYITTYFRLSFVASNPAGLSNLILTLAYDDAAIAYLNGREWFRAGNLPAGAVAYNTLATGQAIEETVVVATFATINLIEGTNVLAVEVHQQAIDSSDISFFLQVAGAPVIIHNLSPTVELTSPTNNFFALAPPGIALTATAADADGSVAKVEYYADGVKVAESVITDYSAQWLSPPVGPHSLTAVAVDDQGARTESAAVSIIVYDDAGTPFAQITAPKDGTAVEGGTNQLITAFASAQHGVTNVEFLSNGTLVGQDATNPFSVVWNASFGTNALTAVAIDANGMRGTSAVVRFIAFPNTNAPRITTNFPAPFATLTNLTSITVVFSEPVQNVDADDLLLNTYPATGVTGSGSNYVFTFPPQSYGEVEVVWRSSHGITDFGYPSNLPFDELGQTAQWEYFLIDKMQPTVAAQIPAAGALITNLAQISVTFSEWVTNVDAADLLVNGVPATGVSGSGSNYAFSVTQPAPGTVNVTWATNHGILDVAETPNAFNRTGAGATWNYTLDNRVVLVASNSNWQFVKGFAEASTPPGAWRQPGFDDSSWTNAPAPFFFGDPYTNAAIQGTLLSDMLSNYTTIFLRKEFTIGNRGAITNLLLSHQSDDGFIAWLNGYEVWRYNVPGGELPYTAGASSGANEPNQIGAAYIQATLTNSAVSRLVNGVNILAIQAFNQNLNSGDFGINAQLYYFPVDASAVPPRMVSSDPAAGDLFSLTNVTINFSEGVSGVDAGDLLVNGEPATGLTSTTNATYTFRFPQPPYGPVLLTWATNHGIADFDSPPKPFDGAAAGARISYTLLNPSSPRIVTQTPLAGNTITGLTSISMIFTEPVAGVDAADLLINGTPAATVSSADNTSFLFSFPQPSFGAVAIRWATNHGITDREDPPASFDPTRFGGQWNYTLIDPVPSVTITSPTNNTYVLNPANLTLRATASDNDGVIALVEFFSNGSKLGEAAGSPYLLTVSNVPLGSYTLRAIATDNTGLRGTSAPVSFNVVTSLPITLVRGPYLQSGSSTGGVVRWRTDVFSDAVVQYGADPTSLTNVAVETMQTNEHIVSIRGLQPDTQYFYSIGSADQRLAGTNGVGSDYWFNTSPVPGTRKHVRFWALGDAGTAGNGSPDRQRSTRDAFYSYAATNGATDLMLMLGDNAYNSGTDSEHQAAVFDMYPTTLRNKFLWPTLGNHETSQSTTATDFPYLNIFSLPQNGEAGGVASGTEKYYSFDYANVHFVCLDAMTSGRTATTPMALWLVNDLEATAQDWIVVFFHHSLYTKGTHDSDSESDLVELRQNIIPILEAHSVDLVLMGHSHVYERSYLLDGHYGLSSTFTDSMKVDGGDGREEGTGAYRKNDENRGVVYNIAGCAGQALGGPLNHPAHFISLNELGTVVIDVTGGRLDAAFLTATGDIHDHYSLMKPDPIPPAPLHLIALATNASTIALSWTPNSTRQTGFVIERSLDGFNFTQQMLATADATNALDFALLANATYYYRIRATNSFGLSDYSNIASATTVAPNSVPRAPTALAANASSGTEFYRSQMLLRWQDRSTNESAFQIERSIDGSTFDPVSTVAANVNFYLDRNLVSGTEYYYRVRAFNGRGFSDPSNLAADTTHPQSQVALEGTVASFHAGSEGAPGALYQWRFLGGALPGQTNESLVLGNVQPADEGDYTVLITEASGHFVSHPAYLFVVGPPHIVTHPLDRTNLVNTAASFTVAVSGTAPFTYRWRKNSLPIPGATSPTLNFPSPQLSDQGAYDVLVENEFGSVISRQAQLFMITPPSVGTMPNILADVLTSLSVTTAVIDPNIPPLNLTYSLTSGAPTNAAVNPSSGIFRWTPTRAQANTTNPITIRFLDASRPFLSNSVSYTVVVNDFIEMTAGTTVLLTGSSTNVPIDFFTSARLTGLQSVLQLDTNRLGNLAVDALAPALASVSLQMLDTNTAQITFTAATGQTLLGTQHLARLRFTALTNRPSGFLPLHFTSLGETRDTPGIPLTPLAVDGRVAVIGTEPLVEAFRNSTGQRSLNIYGNPGITYAIQQSTNASDPASWTLRGNISMGTNLLRTVTVPSNPIFYQRLRQLP